MNYIGKFKELIPKVFIKRDQALGYSLLESRNFEDLSALVKSELIKEQNLYNEDTDRSNLLLEFQDLLDTYCKFLDIDTIAKDEN